MTSKTHYATLGVVLTATQDQIKRAYRNLARRFHPDVSGEPNAEERFKEVAAAREALADPEQRLRYDAEPATSPRNDKHPGPRRADWQPGFAATQDASMRRDFREFFATTTEHWRVRGDDQHGVVLIEIADAYRGATRSLNLQIPSFDSHGALVFSDLQLEVRIPRGVLDGQQLRLKGLGAAGQGGAPAGDLYLEVIFRLHPPFRLDGRDVLLDLPVAPWEAALGATVLAPTPTGTVQLSIPPGAAARLRLRLQGLGLPGSPPGDLYAALDIVLPPGDGVAAQQAWLALADAFPDYRPRG